MPKDAIFVCAYYLNIGPDSIEVAAFFRQVEGADELWIAAGTEYPFLKKFYAGSPSLKDIERCSNYGIGCAFRVPSEGEEHAACYALLDRFIRVRSLAEWPETCFAGGMVSWEEYNGLIDRFKYELKENARKAREHETEIIEIARELGLSPQPYGTGPSYWWQARCPGKNHPLFINAEDNTFFCGWCSRNGGIEELRAFVEERDIEKRSKVANRT